HAGKTFTFHVDSIEPMRRISFRWHPYAVEPGIDYSQEPTTLILFSLEEVADDVLLTICESGFDRIPLERRAKAFAANDGGWTKQVQLIAKYLAGQAS
ncbi:MAG TPA: SRPBCC domain-containing protein, partial [Rhodopila sp.]|nr:SRPBCC domain-containing protein [Rhodopila sp.]